MSLPTPIQACVDEVKNVVNAGRPFLGGAFIDEQAFFIATSQLKRAFPVALIEVARKAHGAINSIRAIDELEMIIENANGHMFGKVWINRQSCLTQIDELQAAFHTDLKRVEQSPPSPEAEVETEESILAQAYLEAARTVDEAQQEAQRILKEARDKTALGIDDSPA